jgi:hypothetical protein
LWDAIGFSLDKLETIRKSGQYSNAAHYRILVFSNGNDQSSKLNNIDLVNQILETPVFVDSIHPTTKGLESSDLVHLSQITGGFSCKPEGTVIGLRIFEKESFLRARLRPQRFRERGVFDEA